MAFHNVAVSVFAALSLVTNLRDVQEVQTEQGSESNMNIVRLSLKDAARELAESHRVELMQEAVSVLARLRSENVTDYTGEHSSELNDVITTIENSIFVSMDNAHNTMITELANSIVPAQQCNQEFNMRNGSGGDVDLARLDMEYKRTYHVECLVQQQTDKDLNDTEWQALESHYNTLGPTATELNTPVSRTETQFEAYYVHNPWPIDFEARYTAYMALHDAWVAADTALQNKAAACAENQASFESEYCTLRHVAQEAWTNYDTCWMEANTFYNGKLQTSTDQALGRQRAYRSGKIIVAHVNCLLTGNCIDDIDNMEVDTSLYDIEPHVQQMPDEVVKDDDYMKHEPCSIAFLEENYNTLLPAGTITSAYIREQTEQACTVCAPWVPIGRSKTNEDGEQVCANILEPGQFGTTLCMEEDYPDYEEDCGVDQNGAGCDWYYNNPNSCGFFDVLDGPPYFEAKVYCCACGGGTPTVAEAME